MKGLFQCPHTTWAHEKIEEFEHPNLRRISRFAQLLDIL